MNAGTGRGAFVAIQSASPSTIFMNFPNLITGGYAVNGVPGVVYDVPSASGFIAGGLPAILGENLIISYGLKALPESVLVEINQTMDSISRVLTVGPSGEDFSGVTPTDELKNKASKVRNGPPICK